MTANIYPEPGRITVSLNNNIKVTYDNITQSVEVLRDKEVVTIQEAPKGYTVAQFISTINKVQDYFNQ